MSSRITSGIGMNRCDDRTITSTGWFVLPNMASEADARERVLATGERARLAVGLQRRDDLLGHLLEVGHLVEADGVPDPDQPHLAGRHVVEQVGDGRRAGQQDGVGRQLLVGVALAGPPWAEFDEVVVRLAEREQPDQEEQLQPAVEVGRLHADAADQQVDPLVGRELAAALPVLVEVERGELDRLEALDPERAPLPLGLLVVLVLECPPAPRCRPSAGGRSPAGSARGCGRSCARS